MVDSEDGDVGGAGVIRFTNGSREWWEGWCEDFRNKVYPIFRAHGFTVDAAAMIYIQKQMRHDLEDVASAVDGVRQEIARWDVSTEEPREEWQGDGDNG